VFRANKSLEKGGETSGSFKQQIKMIDNRHEVKSRLDFGKNSVTFGSRDIPVF
jgi:hypothetical protein